MKNHNLIPMIALASIAVTQSPEAEARVSMAEQAQREVKCQNYRHGSPFAKITEAGAKDCAMAKPSWDRTTQVGGGDGPTKPGFKF